MEVSLENSIVGLAVQAAGVALVAVLSLLLDRSVRRTFLDYWTASWVCLTLALAFLLLAFCLAAPLLYFFYFLGEYAYGYLFLAGCRSYATGARLGRRDRWALVPGVLIAASLTALSADFNVCALPHTLILMAFWVASLWALRPARRERPGLGVRVLSVALILLPIDFSQYVMTQTAHLVTGGILPFPHMKYSSLYDLVLEILAAFGTVMIALESVRAELERGNRELVAAGARLRLLSERDALTGAFNRSAFSALFTQPPLTGCVAVVDVDDFKTINDTLGHAAGDAALRTAARTLRGQLRPDDLLFRWGADEFLILLPGVLVAEARDRLEHVNALLRAAPGGPKRPLPLAISYGVAPLTGASDLDRAIEEADREMHRHKQGRKGTPCTAETIVEDVSVGCPV